MANVIRIGALFLLTVTGCADRKAEVTGRVTYKGKPLVFGTITFAPKGTTAGPISTEIRPDGTYSFAELPAGPVQVGVYSPDPKIPRETKNGKELWPTTADRNLWFPIPSQYNQPFSSGLEVVLTPGPNTHDIDLK